MRNCNLGGGHELRKDSSSHPSPRKKTNDEFAVKQNIEMYAVEGMGFEDQFCFCEDNYECLTRE